MFTFRRNEAQLANLTRGVLESVTVDVVRKSTEACGLGSTQYQPEKIPISVYGHGDVFRQKNYPSSSDPGYLKSLFEQSNMTAPPKSPMLLSECPAYPEFKSSLDPRQKAEVRTRILDAPCKWSLSDELSISKRVKSQTKHFDPLHKQLLFQLLQPHIKVPTLRWWH